jgi:hypothetical protein
MNILSGTIVSNGDSFADSLQDSQSVLSKNEETERAGTGLSLSITASSKTPNTVRQKTLETSDARQISICIRRS